MITQAMNQTRFQPRRSRPGILAIGLGFGLSLGLGSVPGTETEARAAKISKAATDAPLKYPTYLNDQGTILSGSNVTHSLSAKDKSKAAYVAYKLQNGATVTKAVPLMKTTAPVSSGARQAIATVSSGVGTIAVKTQRGLYLVNNYQASSSLATHKAAVKNKVAVKPSAATNLKVATSHVAVKSSAQHLTGTSAAKATKNNTSTSSTLTNLKKLFNLNAAKASLESSPIGKLLKLDSTPKATTKAENLQSATTPSTSLTLVPAGVHEAPVPEPGTLAFAGLAIGGAMLREGLRRRKAKAARV